MRAALRVVCAGVLALAACGPATPGGPTSAPASGAATSAPVLTGQPTSAPAVPGPTVASQPKPGGRVIVGFDEAAYRSMAG